MYLTSMRRNLEPNQDVYSNLGRLSRLMDEAFSAFSPAHANGDAVGSAWTPNVDIREDQNHITISMDVPGVRPEDVKISLENQVLTIAGEKQTAQQEKDERWHRWERQYGRFERTFTLPSTVDAERIEATNDNGVLTVRLPKSEKARPREIPVRTSR
jgi:HSP20 family protein